MTARATPGARAAAIEVALRDMVPEGATCGCRESAKNAAAHYGTTCCRSARQLRDARAALALPADDATGAQRDDESCSVTVEIGYGRTVRVSGHDTDVGDVLNRLARGAR